jgi:hypothetical protein
LHLAVDPATGDIFAAVASTNDLGDLELLPDLLKLIQSEIERVCAEGAYDTWKRYDAIERRGAKVAIPPHKNTVIWQQGNHKVPVHPRDQNLRAIRRHGRKRWKQAVSYHRRSLSESTMFRHKHAFTGIVR